MTVLPVTLSYFTRHAVQASSGEVCVLDGKEVAFIRFMGKVIEGSREVDGLTTLYVVEDAISPGNVPILVFASASEKDEEEEDVFSYTPAVEVEPLLPDVYYTFHGIPRYLSVTRGTPPTHIHVDIYSVRRVADMNELTFHGLDCIHTHLVHK